MLLSSARIGDRDRDVLIVDGRIAEIGSIGTGDLDLGGRWLIPGLWDNHVHFTQWALTSQRLDVSAATSAAEVVRLVAAAIDDAPGILVGAGFRDGLWPDAPTAALLDEVSGRMPVALVSGDLHAAWLNTAALESFGHAQHPTGLLREADAFDISRKLGEVDELTIDGWAHAAAKVAASRGLVGIADLEMAWNRDTWERRIAAGNDLLRVQFAVYAQHLDRAIDEELATGLELGSRLTVGGFKILTDGSLNTRTAYTHDEYPDGGTGMLTVPPHELLPLLRRASGAGLDPWVHAIGDHANTLALDAFEELGVGGRIEHAQLLSVSDYPRFAELGVVASVQPEHAMDDRDVADAIWAGRTDRLYPFQSLLEAGASLAFGSDAPVAPLDPWVSMDAAVTRSRDGREPWHPEQRIAPQDALDASARSRLAVGEPGDVVAVESDPLGYSVRDMPVALTVVGGQVTHSTL